MLRYQKTPWKPSLPTHHALEHVSEHSYFGITITVKTKYIQSLTDEMYYTFAKIVRKEPKCPDFSTDVWDP